MKHCIRVYHVHHIHDKIVQIHPLSRWRALFYHPLDAPNHITGTASIRHDISEQIAELAEIDLAAINKTLPSTSVADNSREGLIQFMSNGCRHFSHHCNAAEMPKFFAPLQRFRFCELASRNVHDRS